MPSADEASAAPWTSLLRREGFVAGDPITRRVHGRFAVAAPAVLAIEVAITWPRPSFVFLGWIVLVFAIVIGWHAQRPIMTFDDEGLVIDGTRVSWKRVRSMRFTGDLLRVEVASEDGEVRVHRGVRSRAPRRTP